MKIFDIKIDRTGRIIFADLDRIYAFDTTEGSCRVIADQYYACKGN
jgi:DNA-binding LytR/AlgR family response regulator